MYGSGAQSEVWAGFRTSRHKDGIWKRECMPLGRAFKLMRRLGIFEEPFRQGKGPEGGEEKVR